MSPSLGAEAARRADKSDTMVANEVTVMKQTSLWICEGDRVGDARWKKLPEKVRAELVGQLVRLIVKSLISVSENNQALGEKERCE